MAGNKFIERLKGQSTRKSVLEVKNEATKASFANMPSGSSNALQVYDDARGDATAVLKGTEIWKLQNNQLVAVNNIYGDGRDFTSTYTVSGNTTWVNAVYTLDRKMIFTGATKWVLKLCGHSLLSEGANTINFSLLIKFNNSPIITKNFTVTENAFEFCKEFIIDFNESEQTAIKMAEADTITLQLLCADATASATIYNGMTTLVAQQRRVDGETVASDLNTFEDIEVEVAQLREDLDDLEEYVDDTFVRLDGNSIMTGPLKMRATSSFQCAIAPFWDGVGFYKLNDDDSVTLIASIETPDGFVPWVTNTYNIGSSLKKWKNLYLSGKAYMSVINNGYDIAVPVTNSADTFALKSQVDLAANSGRMITPQGVWYAKMYAATVAPSAEDGTNYADFSQVDGQGNPIIVIYERQSGVWVQSETITPPAEYDGYVPITSKIWDIAEQAGQQGGRILWNHQSKEFTPYPQIISFEDIEVTGNSTVIMPQNPSASQIVNKDYVDNKVSSSIGNGTITLTQSGNTMGTFTTNQSGDTTIALDGGSSYHPDLFAWEWSDALRNDVQWLRADTFSWQSGSVYQAAYKHLRNDMYNWYSWTNNGTTIYTKKAYPEVGEKVYSDSALTTEVGEITAVTDTLDITVEKITVNGVVYDSVSGSNIAPTTETVGGVTVQYIPAEDGHKIVTDFHESEVADVYTATGVAWYYIIDYGFKRFKLPRTKFGVTGLRDTVGKYVEAGLPNITGTFQKDQISVKDPYEATGCVKEVTSLQSYDVQAGSSGNGIYRVTIDASESSSVYGNSTTVQPPATQMYLYFYVGNFTQSALENTAGLNAELFNDKVDKGHEVIAFQAPTAGNNYTWYRLYADGWVEQGGVEITSNTTITLPIAMANTKYTVLTTPTWGTATSSGTRGMSSYSKTTTSFTAQVDNNSGSFDWQVSGMAA